MLSAREAEANLQRGIESNDFDAVTQAVALRPDDPRYRVHEAVMRDANQLGGGKGPLDMAAALIQVSDPSWGECGSQPDSWRAQEKCVRSVKDARRQAEEMYLDATREAIYAAQDGPVRQRMVERCCEGITSRYVTAFTDDFPLETSLYVATADFSLCP